MNKKILDELYSHPGEYVSGQKLCEILGVSRTAVWKHIRELTEQGYDIRAEGGRGYMMHGAGDILNAYEISRRIPKVIEVHYVESVDSTNNLAKSIASGTQKDFTVIAAGRQCGGRGRIGRKFDSANEKGVWCSFLLKPDMEPEKALSVTVASAIAVCRTLEDTCGVKAGIKWPNDIILSNKKVCGILSEMSCETGVIDYIVIGIGINVLQEEKDFTEDIRNKAVSLFMETGTKFSRAEITASLCYNMQEMFCYLKNGHITDTLKAWEDYTLTDGKRIRVLKNGRSCEMTAVGIDDLGRLITDDDKGKRSTFTSGEISVRGLLGYI